MLMFIQSIKQNMTEQLPTPNQLSKPDLLNPDFVTTLGEAPVAIAQALHPNGLALQSTLQGNAETLHPLPFIPATAIGHNLRYPEGPNTSVRVENARFPISRIVGIQGFDSWAGRGRSASGGIIGNGGYSSLTGIQHYAGLAPKPDYQPALSLFKDADGEVWGYLEIDGAHRTTGAKLRGDTELQCSVGTDDYDRLPQLDWSVAEEVGIQSKVRSSFIGRTLLKRQARKLAADSEAFDVETAARREDLNNRMIGGSGYF